MTDIEALYAERTASSARAFRAASRWLANGVAGDVKRITPHPPVLRRGAGAYVEDIDGHRLLDMRMGASSLIFGHAYPPVTDAIRRQLDAGLLLSLPTELDSELAERICQLMPSVERVRFVNSGSEATIFAVRAARAVTGRPLVAKFEGSFHGHANESLLVSNRASRYGVASRPDGVASAAGLSSHLTEDVVVLPFDDPDAVTTLIKEYGHDLAAVVMEPVPVSGAISVPAPTLLAAVRESTRRVGALLIFDEMISGFRLSPGGAAQYFGVSPDLVAFGKVLGGGMPIGAYGGTADVMTSAVTAVGTRASIRQSGTFSGHPLAMAAGLATVAELERRNPYLSLGLLGAQLREGLRDAVAETGAAIQVTGLESLFHLTFIDEPVTTRRAAASGDAARHRAFCLGMITEGVFMMPGQPGFLSTAHTADDVATFVGAVRRVLPLLDAGR